MSSESATAPPLSPSRQRIFCVFGVALLIFAVAQIGFHYGACPQDDAFISFRYAQNWVNGHGLVYNPGEWVEGYSNLSWTLIMGAVIAMEQDPVVASALLGISAVFGTIILLVGLAPHRKTKDLSPAWLLAPTFLTIDAQMILEAVEGLETSFYMMLVTAAVLTGIRELRNERAHLVSTLLFGLAVLTRPEAPLLFGLFHLGAYGWSSNRSRQLRQSITALIGISLLLAGLTLWRLNTYGMPLPNTYYAKTGGFALPRGLAYLGNHIGTHIAMWMAVGLRLLAGPKGRDTRILLLLCSGQLTYVAWIGGDFKPTGRFIIPVLPLLCLLAQDGLILTGARLRRTFAQNSRIQRIPSANRVIGTLFWAMTLTLSVRDLRHGLQLSSVWALDRHANLESRKLVGTFLKDNFPPETVIAIHSAGAIPFYAELQTIDMWGLTNSHIAHSTHEQMGTGLAGHEKTDPVYVFSQNPDLYLPEDRVFTYKAWDWDLKPGPHFPDDFTDDYVARSIPFTEGRLRHLNLWIRRGLLMCQRSAVLFEQETKPVISRGRYNVGPCEVDEIQTWADLDKDGIVASDPSCCFSTPTTAPSATPTQFDLRGFVRSTPSEWDCDDNDPEIGSVEGLDCE